MNVYQKLQPERIVRMDELLRRLQISRATVYRWTDEGKFPRPMRLGPRAMGWKESVLSEWIENLGD